MPNVSFHPRLVLRKPAWGGTYTAGTHQAALRIASTVPYASALSRFPSSVLRSGTSGWKSSANSSAKKTPSVKWESSPTRYVAAVGAAVAGRPRISSPLATGQFSWGSPTPRNQMPKTVANWGATAPASNAPPIGWVATQARQRGRESSVGMRVTSPDVRLALELAILI